MDVVSFGRQHQPCGDSKKCKKLSASDILAKIFENRDLPEICLHDFQVNGSLFGNRDHDHDLEITITIT